MREHGYLIIDPAEYGRYEMNQRILAALREDDLRLFDDYTELHRVLHAERRSRVRHRRGAHAASASCASGCCSGRSTTPATPAWRAAIVDAGRPSQARAYDGAFGPAYWRRVLPQFVRVDLNAFYRQRADAAGKPLEWLCALRDHAGRRRRRRSTPCSSSAPATSRCRRG